MRILMLAFNRVGEGTYWRALDLGRYLVQRGLQVSLLATATRRRWGLVTRNLDGVTLVETPDLFRGSLRSGWDLWNTAHRLGWLRGRAFDLVHAFEARPTVLLPALYLQRLRRTPLVMDWADWFGRGGSVEQRPNPLLRAILRPVETFFEERFRTQADGTTVISKTLLKKARRLGVPADQILLLPNGCEPERFPRLDPVEARAHLGLAEGGSWIGYVGSIFQQDARFMASAFERVAAEVPEVRLVVAGYCPFDIGGLVGRPEAVLQTGRLSETDLGLYLAACDLFWLPLRDTNANRGRFPLKLNDYMAVGRPVVATRVGDIGDLVEQTGIGLASPDEPLAFATCTLSLLQDPHRRQTMGRRARALAENEYHWRGVAHTLEQFYGQVLSQTGRQEARG